MSEKPTKTGQEVLEYFFVHPENPVHLRQLAREMDVPYSSARSAVNRLEEEGYVKSEEKGNMTVYTAAGEKFRSSKRAYNIKSLYTSGLVEHLEEELRPDALVLFGSYSNGTDREESDIDIAVVNGREADIELEQYGEDLGRDIHLVAVPDATEEDESFRNTLANGYVLSGYLEVV
ncbi:MAG: nucleotidyltransferase domain-containing protein [Candidatus Nanohaloarchaea archaeon]|nr:nucleotidyltransferase domain-containing protein [Candidatus Nanohaloarchaea archaeon]